MGEREGMMGGEEGRSLLWCKVMTTRRRGKSKTSAMDMMLTVMERKEKVRVVVSTHAFSRPVRRKAGRRRRLCW